MSKLNFDANEVEPSQDFSPLPDGDYVAAITESGMKRTKAGDGEYLELVFSVLEGPKKGRRVWERLNLKNPNDTAVQIARANLSAICRAVGVMTPRDSVELHNIPVIIRVVADGEYNRIKSFKPRSEAGATRVDEPAEQAATSSPPWRR